MLAIGQLIYEARKGQVASVKQLEQARKVISNSTLEILVRDGSPKDKEICTIHSGMACGLYLEGEVAKPAT